MDRNKESFSHRSKTQELGVGECCEPQNFSIFGRQIGPKLKKLEGFLQKGNTENEQARNLNNQWNNRASSFTRTVYYCYEWRDPDTEKKG